MHSIHHLPAGEASKLTPLRHPRPRRTPRPEIAGPSRATEGRRVALRRLTGYLTA